MIFTQWNNVWNEIMHLMEEINTCQWIMNKLNYNGILLYYFIALSGAVDLMAKLRE